MAARHTDVIVVGAGHNGLIAAGLLARQGARVIVLEAREQIGGAAITEQPFGPDYKVSALSYVVSLLPRRIVDELRLADFGYHVYPQHGYFAPRRDGGYLQLPDDLPGRIEAIARFSRTDAAAYPDYDAWIGTLARVLSPLLVQVPPRLGSLAVTDLIAQARLGFRLRRLGVQGVGDLTRLFSLSVADLLDRWFVSDALRGVLCVSGVIGTWAGPRSAGTAYVMLHHKVGDPFGGAAGAWGFPRGGMGGLTGALAAAARHFGAQIRTGAPVARVRTRSGRVVGVVLEDGTELDADVVVSTAHPRITFLQHLDPAELPDDLVRAVRCWRTRSGTVKVNFAVDRLPEFTAKPGFDPHVHGGTIVLAESLDDVEAAFQDAAAGRPADLPFADVCIPSVFDPSLAPPGHHVVSAFTQWVPHTWADAPDPGALAAYADRVTDRLEAVAPGFAASVRHRQVIGPHEMQQTYHLVGGNIFHGELAPDQMFHMRPAPGHADYRTPIRGLYQAGSATHGGGGVTGIPALQAVAAVRADRRRGRLR